LKGFSRHFDPSCLYHRTQYQCVWYDTWYQVPGTVGPKVRGLILPTDSSGSTWYYDIGPLEPYLYDKDFITKIPYFIIHIFLWHRTVHPAKV